MQTLLRGAQVYTGHRFSVADVLIEDGIIAEIFPNNDSADDNGIIADIIIELNNRYIFPGFTDVHVHFREPGFSYKEDMATGTAAAAAGGYTDVCAMPNLIPVPDSTEHLGVELEAIMQDALIHVYPYGSLSVGEQGGKLSDIEELAGSVIAFSDDGKGLADSGLMEAAMRRAKVLGKVIAAHCEDMSVIGGAHVHAGRVAEMLGIEGISSASEWKMVERDIELVRKTGCSYHVCHVSTKESVDLIRRAKGEGLDITCETGPHYLLLDENTVAERLADADDIYAEAQKLGRFKMNPPLRSRTDREALLEGLMDGTIDMIATDHAPHTAEEKGKGLLGAPMGVVGLECAFPVLYTGLVLTGKITLEKLIEKMTSVPAERFGIKSGIEKGEPANLCVYDLNEEYIVNPADFASKGRSTPFDGAKVKGRCIMTICDGKIVYENW